jgi:hypothetical protein
MSRAILIRSQVFLASATFLAQPLLDGRGLLQGIKPALPQAQTECSNLHRGNGLGMGVESAGTALNPSERRLFPLVSSYSDDLRSPEGASV